AERGVELVVGLMGVLKAGGAYVPMDPAYPEDRLRYMLDDSAPVVLLTRDALAARFADTGIPVVVLDGERAAWIDAPASALASVGVTPSHPAYVIYTSGSTGQPKGVVVEHRQLASYARAITERLGLERGMSHALVSTPAADLGNTVLFPALITGGTLHLLPHETATSAERFSAYMGRHEIDVLKIVPSHLAALLSSTSGTEGLPRQRLILGGEASQRAWVGELRRRAPGMAVINHYGPTETTVGVLTNTVDDDDTSAGTVPLGRPLGRTRVYVLDGAGEPVPVGVAGELHVGGAQVARGYLGRPALTAERFVPDAFSATPGARLYRTGDRARWRADGVVEFLGRTDFQVKVRGFRVELGEIDARLAEHAAVRDAVTLAREDVPGDVRLVAYYLADEAVDVQSLRAHLAERLPDHMLPAAFVRLEWLPLTPNGKVDRRALPAPEGDAYATRAYEPPATETEIALAEIWADMLGVERVGRWDNFFELGGHSLRAVQIVSRVRQVLGVDVALGDIFVRPVLAEFARGMETAARADLQAIEPADRTQPLALSFAQQRLWFLEQLGGMGSTYHVANRLRLHGELDRDALLAALDRIVARHEALRTVFHSVDGAPVQRIAPAEGRGFHLLEHDLGGLADPQAELRRVMAREAGAPFDLEGGPLIRGRLIRLADDDHVLLVTTHHIVSDGWSSGVFLRELSALYGAFRRGDADPLPALPIQYADYAAWQRRWVTGDVLRRQVEYWRDSLTGAPELLALPADHPRPAQQEFAGAVAPLQLDEALTAGLKALSRRHGTTLFMTLLAGWAVVLGRLSAQADLVIGTPTANRGRAEIEGLIGFFINTLALRLDLSGAPTVAALLGRVKALTLGAQQNQDIPFEQVVELVQPARSMAHTPLYQVTFTWQPASGDALALPGLSLGSLGAAPDTTAKFDLSLSLREAGGRIVGGAVYATALFRAETIERHLGYVHRVLGAMVADEHRAVGRLALLSEAERLQVVEGWNDTGAAYPSETTIHALFEAQVARTPDAVAVVSEGDSLTYAALNARSNQLAHHLRTLGAGPDARVALCMERGLGMMMGLLGVLKAGAAYVPLDPSYPEDRLRYMLEDSAPMVLLTQAALAERFADAGIPIVPLDGPAAAWTTAPATNPAPAATPDHLAYVIYTSGSTGRPKGVMCHHRGAVNRLAWMQDAYRLQADEAVLQKTSFSFDVSVWEFFWPVMVGARLVMARPEGHKDPGYLIDTVRDAGITTLHFVPSMLQLFLEHPEVERCAGLKRVVCSGEALPASLVRQFHARLPHVELHNLYGPTEAAVDVSAWECRADDVRPRIPIGAPIANTRLYVLDEGGEPVPVSVAGELHIGGVQVARGYLGRPALTAERFVPDPFSAHPGARLYRTGDLARWLAEGAIEYLGRNDHQVKVRGFRIELGEIEARLADHAAVRETVVVAREDVPGDPRLVAYYVAAEALEAEALRAHLLERLPEHMVPAAYVHLAAMPLSANGKVDRKALPAPDGGAFSTRGYEAPEGAAEEALAGIWAEMLGVERVGRRDNFFELGGHSLRAVQVVSRVRQALGVEVALGDLFVRPVLADFARGMEGAARAELQPIEPVDRNHPLPLSFAQQRLWFLEQLGGLGGSYHIPSRLRLHGALDRDALARALDRIVARHEALRTTFHVVDGEPTQLVAAIEESRFLLVDHDLQDKKDTGAELRRLMAEEAAAPFDLVRGPLIRGRLIRLADEDYVLVVTMHHIVSDGWSMGVFTRELGALYGAFRRGEGDPLPALAIQYADYAAWQRRWVSGDVLQGQADYWTETLTGAPELLALPADRPRPAQQDFAGATAALELDEALTAALKAVSRRHGTTLFMTLLAGWAAVLGRLSGQTDLVIGTPTANRGRAEIEGLIGFFINTLAVRVELAGAPTLAELLARVKAGALGAQQHQDIPFEQVVDLLQPARSLSHTPLFQVMFTWQNAGTGGPDLPGLTVGSVGAAASTAAKFDLSLVMGEAGGRIVGSVAYATALFEPATIDRHLGYLRRVLEAIAADEHQPVHRLALLSAPERRQVVETWNDTAADYPADACIHELFEARVEHAPDAPAVVSTDVELTYEDLNARANRLAHHLRSLGVGPDARVAICVERGPEMVVGLLAVLKAGGAYVPMDPAYPVERLRFMLDDSAPAAVLTQGSLAGSLDGLFVDISMPVLDLDSGEAWVGALDTNPPRGGLMPAHLAYVIYTSGSTGRPKGVAVAHRNLANLVAWHCAAFGVEAGQRSSSVAGVGFDAAAWEIWPTLCAGAALVLPADARDPEALLAWWASQPLDVSFLPTPMAEFAFARGMANPHLRALLVGGDRLRHLPAELGSTALVNNYGPTETTVVATSGAVEPGGALHIGRPIANTRVYLVDGAGEPVPVGVAGELHVAGAGVARGYLGRPGLTAERFVPDAFGPAGSRMYRTGDLARWRADGTLEFLGRTDFQVKVRGFRIELGEIETRLAEHADVREAVVVAREDVPGDTRLVAYCVGDGEIDAQALRAHLAERLPEHMLPAAFVHLDRLPLTPNGKVDRKALPAPEGDAFATRGYEAPAGETELALAAIWAEMLGVDRVGRWDNFFELGGHSLRAVQITSRVRHALGVEVALGDLFVRPVLADFARGMESAARTELQPIEPADRNHPLALSFAQQRLWFLEQLGGTGGSYNIPTRLRLHGELDRAALGRALDRIVARHEALRTVFHLVDGEPEQRVVAVEESGFRLVEHDLAGHADVQGEVRRLAAEESGAPFDLAHGPLIRGRLLRLAVDDHLLLVTMHHIVSDGWSMGVFVRELGALYGAFRRGEADPLPPLAIQYADYAAWQRRWVSGEVLQRQADYWKRTLAGAPELLELPTDHARPAQQDFAGAAAQVALDDGLTAALRALGRRHGTTPFMTLLAGWSVVLGRLSGQDDVVIGMPTANRGRAEIEGLIGFFINTLALRLDLSGAPTVAALLARVKASTLDAQQHQDIPFEQVVELVQPVRSLAHGALFQVMFTWQNAAAERLELPGLRLGSAGGEQATTSKFDLSLSLQEAGERIVGGITYATALYERETVERHLGYLRRVLEAMAADDVRPVTRLELLSAGERRQVVEDWNASTADYPRDACIHALFEAQAARTPDADALQFEGETLSYAELNARANRLAHHLADLGVGPDARVAICVERGLEMMVGILGVLKAGGAYVPLDPAYPEDRLRYMLEDSAPMVLLTEDALAAGFADAGMPVVALDGDAWRWADRPATDPGDRGTRPAHLAYVIYTSGSTGRPKGVLVEHRGLVSTLAVARETFAFAPADRVLSIASFAFDIWLLESVLPLLAGAAVRMVPRERVMDVHGLADDLRWATVLHAVPALMRRIVEEIRGAGDGTLAAMRAAFVGGDAVAPDLLEEMRGVFPAAAVNVLYGPTETTIICAAHRVGAETVRRQMVGRPLG
ncbi:MAG TPA: amino acid adenylation domain-containing protein, partial [Longimicrobium sp.]|nr:amino acid adenylation domain-containing protein [Longimicrobium sp.]